MLVWIVSPMTLFLTINSLLAENVEIKIPNLNGPCYVKPGDINLGVIISYSERGSESYCSSNLRSKWGTQYAEVLKYAIETINTRQDILPNISIGYIMMDACDRDLVALARSMSFIPTENNKDPSDSSFKFSEGFTDNCSESVKFYDIAGIVGPENSRYALMVASLMTLFEVPLLGTFTTSDELTDNSRFEYFMR